MIHTFRLLVAACLVATLFALPAGAGEWLGGQYWGQISGCGQCGGSLYGSGWMTPYCDECLPGAPTPADVDVDPHGSVEEFDIGPTVRATAFTRPLDPREHLVAPQISSRRNQGPLVQPPARGEVKIITHQSRPERLQRDTESIRIVAPSVWNDRILR